MKEEQTLHLLRGEGAQWPWCQHPQARVFWPGGTWSPCQLPCHWGNIHNPLCFWGALFLAQQLWFFVLFYFFLYVILTKALKKGRDSGFIVEMWSSVKLYCSSLHTESADTCYSPCTLLLCFISPVHSRPSCSVLLHSNAPPSTPFQTQFHTEVTVLHEKNHGLWCRT